MWKKKENINNIFSLFLDEKVVDIKDVSRGQNLVFRVFTETERDYKKDYFLKYDDFHLNRSFRAEPLIYTITKQKGIPTPRLEFYNFRKQFNKDEEYYITRCASGIQINKNSPYFKNIIGDCGRLQARINTIDSNRAGYTRIKNEREMGKNPKGSIHLDYEDSTKFIYKIIEEYEDYISLTNEDYNYGLKDEELETFLENTIDKDSKNVLTHRDYRKENILHDGRGNVSNIIDWGSSLFLPPKCSLALSEYKLIDCTIVKEKRRRKLRRLYRNAYLKNTNKISNVSEKEMNERKWLFMILELGAFYGWHQGSKVDNQKRLDWLKDKYNKWKPSNIS